MLWPLTGRSQVQSLSFRCPDPAGDPSIQLDAYVSDTGSAPAATLAVSQIDFTLPVALRPSRRDPVYIGCYTEPLKAARR
jgi:hypothetical protein